jgi:hypothetical protein
MGADRKQVQEFRRKFGRKMGAQDPFFFDPEAAESGRGRKTGGEFW